MSLSILENAIRMVRDDVPYMTKQISFDAFAQTEQERGDRIHRYRRYYDGDHDASLTDNMRKMLRLSSQARSVTGTSNEYDPNGAPFNPNHMALIVDTKVNRLKLTGVETDNDSATEWVSDFLTRNRIDRLQQQVHEGVSRDADTFLMSIYDEDSGEARWVHEPAYDGVSGMVVMYRNTFATEPDVAIKIWHTTSEGGRTADTMNVEVWTAISVRRFISVGSGDLKPDPEYADNGVADNPLGKVPITHFRNMATRYDNYGRSDLDDAIPLQDALNRTMVSMITTAEFTGFKVRWAIGGINPPAAVTPGMWVNLTGGEPVSNDDRIEVGEFEQGDPMAFIKTAEWLTDQIFTITQIPNPKHNDGNLSGEALKQKESGLLGKVNRSQISYGTSWEDALMMAWMVEATYGTTPPMVETFNAKWEKPEVRSDKEILENAAMLLQADPNFPMDEYYKIVAPVFGWDDNKIKELSEGRGMELDARLQRLQGVNGFNSFNGLDTVTGQATPQLENGAINNGSN
jgi:hypothetical protein